MRKDEEKGKLGSLVKETLDVSCAIQRVDLLLGMVV